MAKDRGRSGKFGKVPQPSPPDKQGIGAPAAEEEKALAARHNLDRLAKEYHRDERFRDLFWNGVAWFVRTIIFVTIVIVLVVAWHNLAPDDLCWLSVDQLDRLMAYLFSGAVISAVSSQIQKRA